MNVVDLHPEELLDKKEAGTLTAAEAQRLDAHLAQCAACRFEIGARADFSAELDEAEAIELGERSSAPLGAPQIIAHRIVAEAVREIAPPIAPTTSANIASLSAPPIRTTRRARRGMMVLLAAAALLVAGVGWGSWREGGPRALYVALMSNVAPAPSATESVRPKPAPRGHAAATTPRGPNDSPETPSLPTSSLAPDVEPVIAVQNAAIANPAISEASPNVISASPSIAISPVSPRVPSAPSVGHHSSTALATAHASHASSRKEASANMGAGVTAAPMPEAVAAAAIAAPPAATPAPVVEMSAASLFDAANGARARGDRDRAIALYHDLQSRFAGTNEARVSRVTLGRFLLDGGDANGALSAFDTALRDRPGELEEEAMVGRALALRRLGRDNDEAAAWKSLLSVYPTSPHAARARARLATLAR